MSFKTLTAASINKAVSIVVPGFITVLVSTGASADFAYPTCGTDSGGFQTCHAVANSFGGHVSYDYYGFGVGKLKYRGYTDSVTFRPDHLTNTSQFANGIDPYGVNGTSPEVTGQGGKLYKNNKTDSFNFDVWLNSSGEFLGWSSNVKIKGAVDTGTDGPAFDGILGWLFPNVMLSDFNKTVVAEMDNGTELDGTLVKSHIIDAGTNQTGANSAELSFIHSISGIKSPLLGFNDESEGFLEISNIHYEHCWLFCGNGMWDRDWTATGNAHVWVPVPGAVWLFGSAVLGLSILRRRLA